MKCDFCAIWLFLDGISLITEEEAEGSSVTVEDAKKVLVTEYLCKVRNLLLVGGRVSPDSEFLTTSVPSKMS